MHLCFHGTLVRGERLDLESRLRAATTFGYTAVDCTRAELQSLPASAADGLWKELGLVPGLVGGLVNASPFAPEDAFTQGIQGIEARAAAAAEAGATMTGIVLPNRSDLPEPQARALILQRLRRIGQGLAGSGIRLAVEFLGVRTLLPERSHPFLQSYTAVLDLLTETGYDQIGLLLDAYHWYASGTSAAAVAATPAQRLVYLHINDCKPGPLDRIQDADRLIPGEGVIDLPAWLRAVAATGFDGCIAPEVLGPRLQGMTTAEAATACAAGMRAAMHAADIQV